jgi:trans-aconitate methyltransferase
MARLGLLRRIGPSWLKKLIWNVEFRGGKWDYLHPPDNLVTFLLQIMGPASSLLDLGCGNGVLAACLRSRGWSGQYTGVDVSSVALRLASQRNLPSCQWVIGDFGSYRGHDRYDAILMIESLYYLAMDQVESFLGRLATLLTPAGSIVVRIHDTHRHGGYVALIEKVFPVAQKFVTRTGQVYFVQRNDGGSEFSPI